MITVLYGKTGTGKSTRIIDMIKQDCKENKKSYLIVPEQKTLITEREIALSTEASCQLYTEATNFTRLANSVFRKIGGLNYNYITKSGKSLIMYRAVCEVRDSLKSMTIAKGREKGATKAFLDAVGELKTYGISTEQLLCAAEAVETPKLRDRLNDLALVKGIYEKILYEKFSDPYDDILLLAKKLEEYSFFKGANVYIDSFYGFTGAQWSVIKQIANQADNLVIALDMPLEGNKEDYAKIGKTAEILEKELKPEKVAFTEDKLHTNKAIEYLSDNLWRFDAPPLKDYEGITLVSPQDEFDECEYVASEIKRLVMNGASYSDIAVIVGKSEDYDGIIDMIFDKYGIPGFFSKKTDISAKPLMKMIFSAINAVEAYRLQDISDYMKCGYTDISLDKASELESYMRRWGIQGKRKFEDDEYWGANPDGYVLAATEGQLNELASIHETREQIIKGLLPLKDAFEKKATCEELLRALYTFLENHKVRDKLNEEIKRASKEDANEIAQLYNGLVGALDTVYDVVKDEIFTPEAFLTVLRYALDGVKVGSIPTGEDKVTVGDASGIRTKNIKHVFILGATAGKFPADVQDDGYFSDRDKIELETNSIILSSSSDIRSADELLNFKNAIAVASETVCISAPKSSLGGQGKLERSIGFLRAEALLSGIKIKSTLNMPLYEKIYTKEVAREYLSYPNSPTVSAISSLLGEKAEKAGFSNDDITVDEESVKEIFPNHMNLSNSQIETYVRCHFKYYCDRFLKLRDDKKITFASDKIGNLAHHVFELYLKKIKEEKLDINALTEDEIKNDADEIIDAYINALCEGGVVSKRLARLFSILRKNIYIILLSMIKELKNSKFTPEYFELEIGKGENGIPGLNFSTDKGATLTINGKCDRVDIMRSGNDTYVRVIDYKSGSKEISRADMEIGLGLQLLIYLFSICKMGDCEIRKSLAGNGEILPAGAIYLPMKIGKEAQTDESGLVLGDVPSAERNFLESKLKRNGIFLDDEEILRAQDPELNGEYIPKYSPKKTDVFVSAERFEEIYEETKNTIVRICEEMLSGDASAKPFGTDGRNLPCEYCGSRALCRRRK